MKDTVKQRAALVLSLLSISVLLMPSYSEWLIILLICLFAFIVFKPSVPDRRLSVDRSVSIGKILLSVLIVLPLAANFLIKGASESYTRARFVVVVEVSVLLFIGGLFFVYAMISDRKKPGESEVYDDKVSDKILIFYGIFSLVAMLFATQSSPLYPMNFWDDSNIYHTVANSMLHGKVLYVDVHEQKGLATYLMELPGVIISQNSFFGMYLTEAVAMFFYMVFSLKIVSLFIKPDKAVTAFVPVFALTTFTSVFFHKGGCIEELLLPFTTYTMYLGLRAVRKNVMFTYKEAFIAGLITSWVFWSKYIECGIFLGFVLFVVIYCLMRKEGKKILSLAGCFIVGFAAVSVLVFGYFIINGAVPALIDGYFLGNLKYAGMRQPEAEGSLLSMYLLRFSLDTKAEHLFFIFVYSGFSYLIVKKERRSLLFAALTFVCAAAAIYGGGFRMGYYIVGLKFISALGWIPFLSLISKASGLFSSRKTAAAMTVYSVAITSAALIILSPAVFKLGTRRSDCPQYRFAATINSVEDPKLLNFDFLDTGFYMAAGILPFHNHYCTISIGDVYGYEQIDILNAGTADFIVTDKLYGFDDYELCDYGSYANTTLGGYIYVNSFYLYRRIE